MKFLSDNLLPVFLAILILFSAYDILSKPQESEKIVTKVKKPEKKPSGKKFKLSDKKREFCDLVVPIVDKVHGELEEQFYEISKNLNNLEYKQKISNLKKKYSVETDEELLMALKPHPKSIAIAQAAIESAWAKSRFCKEANNLYGMWSINKDKPRIAASQMRGENTIWLKKYVSLEESIRDYYRTLGRSDAYQDFRELKMQTDDPCKLVEKLDKYSEMGDKYTEDLSKIIKYNRFYIYDE